MNFMLKKSKRFSLARGLISGIVLWSLTFSSLPLYAVETDPSKIITERKPGKPPVRTTGDKGDDSKTPGDVIPSSLGDIQALIIPEAFGTIKELFRGSKEGAFIFHIQDVHVNMEVQENIAKIVDQVNRTYFDEQVSVVAVEGAKGDVDLGLLRAVPDENLRNETSQYLMRQGLLTGPEYYGVHYQQQARVFGIEDGLLYFDNLSAFRDSIQTSQKTSKVVQQFQQALDVLTANLASPELKDFYAKQLAYEANELPLSQYVQHLQNLSTDKGARIEVHPNIKRVMQAIALEEKINFQQLEGEQLQLIGELQQKGTQEQIAALIQNSLDFRTGRLTSDKYYQHLIDTAGSQKIDVKANYMEVFLYAQLVRLQTQINPSILFKEIEWAEKEVKEKMFVSNAEKKVDQIKEDFQVMLALQNLTLSRDHWHYFEDHQTDFNLREWRNFVETEGNKLGLALDIPREWDQLMPQLASAKRFYDDAIKRDQAIVKNLFAELKKRNQKVAFLITGGFHTKGIAQQIKAKDISYAVITPRMTQKYDNALYMSLMMGEPTPFQRALGRGGLLGVAPPIKNPNALTLVDSRAAVELKETITDVALEAISFIGASAFDPAAVQAALDPEIDKNPSLRDRNIVLSQPKPETVVLSLDLEGGRAAFQLERIQTSEGPSLKVSRPEEEGPAPPAAFQGGLAPRKRADHGREGLPSRVLSRKTFSKGKAEERDVDVVEGDEGKGAREIKKEVRKNSTIFTIEGINFAIDNDLIEEAKNRGVSEREFFALLEAAFRADPEFEQMIRDIPIRINERADRLRREGKFDEAAQETNVVLTLFDRSGNAAENHIGDGLIGFNLGFINEIADPIKQVEVQTAFVHELRHEAAPPEEQVGAKLLAFEDGQVPKDVALFFALARERGIDVNEETVAALTTVFDRESSFVRSVGRVVSTRLAAKVEGSELAGDFSTALLSPDAVPNDNDVGIIGGLGVFEAARVAVNPPTILLDLDKLQNPEQLEKFLRDIKKYIDAKKRPRIVITDAYKEVEDPDILKATFDRFVPANIRRQLDEIKTVARKPKVTDREYANQIAEAVEEYQNIRIFTDRWEFYSLVEQALAFVQTLFRDTGDVTIVMTKVEYERVLAALKEVGVDTDKILTVEERAGRYILTLPAEILANSDYMDAIQTARSILAKQA